MNVRSVAVQEAVSVGDRLLLVIAIASVIAGLVLFAFAANRISDFLGQYGNTLSAITGISGLIALIAGYALFGFGVVAWTGLGLVVATFFILIFTG
jgi:small neutral amino acid transporter SnatA (MarC family)